ncbi:MAG: type VII toxin-antitoxin system MntA family adenylyltransferase antitoxin [Candidatus Thorarchaeota archaeon]
MTTQQFTVETVREAVAQVAEELHQRFGVRFILLFGSAAAGESGPLSDVDLAVYMNPQRPRHFDVELTIGSLLTKALQTDDVDVIFLNDVIPPVKFNAIQRGVLLFCVDKGEYEDFCVRAASDFYDYQEFIDKQYESAKEFLDDASQNE